MRQFIQLAVPVILSYVGIMAMGMVDLLFVGRVSAAAIGGVGVGTSWFSGLMIFGIGLLAGLDYLVSHAWGAGERERGYRYFQQGLIVAAGISLPITLMLWVLSYQLSRIGVNPEVIAHAGPYLRVVALSMLPSLVFTACRQYLQAQGSARPLIIIMILANGINALLNDALIFGHFGAPAMGSVGSAWATLFSRVFMLAALASWLVWLDAREDRLIARIPFALDRVALRRVLVLGVPSALQMSLEVGVFVVVTQFAARMRAVDLAAHQIVMNVASFTFMVPLGVSAATAVLVGQALGAGDKRRAVRRGYEGLALGMGFMALSGLFLLRFPFFVLSKYTQDPDVMQVGTQLLFLTAVFQLADGAQVVASGALRGVADTVTAMVANLCGHWLVGLPVGLICAFSFNMGLRGLWIGLSTGLITVAVVLLARWMIKSRSL